MEARSPTVTTTPPPTFSRHDVLRYVVGSIVEQMKHEPTHGECVYTINQHLALCARLGVDATPILVQQLKMGIMEYSQFLAQDIVCKIVKDSPVDLLHITWTAAHYRRPMQSISGISSGAGVKITQTSWNRDD